MSQKKTKEPTWKKQMIAFEPDGSVKWRGPKKGQELQILSRRYNYQTRQYDITHGDPIDWRPNEPFKAALKFLHMYHGAKQYTHALFQRLGSEATYVMREEHLAECLTKGVLVHGVILGEWRFMQRAGRTSIVPIDFISTIDLKESEAEENE